MFHPDDALDETIELKMDLFLNKSQVTDLAFG
jgi:hypothetical protein